MKINYKSIGLLAGIFLLLSATGNSQPKPVYTNYVNPFIGTAPLYDPEIVGYVYPKGWRSWAGLTFPGSSLPNAMVQLSPVTEYGSGAGYEYEDDVILGFTHTNKGHWNLCNIPILPLSKPGSTTYASRFSHQKESAAPGFYQVYLDDYNVGVKLTSTLRCGYHQYAFRDNADRQVLFDLGRANNRVSGWSIEQAGPMAVQGYQQMGERIYFYARLNAKVDRIERKDDGKRNGNAVVYLADGGTQPVELKIGLSFVSAENARANLEAEIADKSFETIRNEATQPGKNYYRPFR